MLKVRLCGPIHLHGPLYMYGALSFRVALLHLGYIAPFDYRMGPFTPVRLPLSGSLGWSAPAVIVKLIQ